MFSGEFRTSKRESRSFATAELRPGDALVEVAAASLNGFDPMILAGSTGLRTSLPMIPCGDYAGRIADAHPCLSGALQALTRPSR